MTRAELDALDAPHPTMGAAEAVENEPEDSGHSFPYLPDLSSQTRWSAHRVPQREPVREPRVIGFRRNDR